MAEPNKCPNCGGEVEVYQDDENFKKIRCKYPKDSKCKFWSHDIIKPKKNK